MNKQSILLKLKGGLIVSCQAEGDEPLNSPQILAALSRAAVLGGAVGIRAERPENIIEIKKTVDVPIIGIYKKKYPDSEVYITPTLKEALEVLEAGSDIIALDATHRSRPYKEKLDQIIAELRSRKDVLLMADVSTLEEGISAAELGFDLIGTTLSGYTEYTLFKAAHNKPDFELLSDMVNHFGDRVPIIAEGRIWTPEDAVEALQRGAFAVVVGTAITRPTVITRNISDAMQRFHRFNESYTIGVDLGGTKTAIGLVSSDGKIKSKRIITSNWEKGTAHLVSNIIFHIQRILELTDKSVRAVGVAASGRVDLNQGIVFDGVPLAEDYIRYPISAEIEKAVNLPVFIENDANAAAFAEYCLMKTNHPKRLVFLTIGTGIGGGIIIDGKLYRGSGNAGEIGHICVEKHGKRCPCGRSGCLEMYASRKVLQEEIQKLIDDRMCYLPEGYDSLNTDGIIELIRSKNPEVLQVFDRQLDYLACGIETVFHTIDPDLMVIGGEIARLGTILTDGLKSRLCGQINLRTSKLKNDAGLIGGALLALHSIKMTLSLRE